MMLVIGVVSAAEFSADHASTQSAIASATIRAANPYDRDPQHLWNRLHQTLFLRTAADGRQFIHDLDPLLFTHTNHLLTGPSHQRATAVMDEFLRDHGETLIDDPLKKAMLQRDLWATFDWNAFVPDDWVRSHTLEPPSRELRSRLVAMIGRLALTPEQVARLPDNLALAAASAVAPTKFDRQHPEQAFLPADLFDENGAWVLVGTDSEPAARTHEQSCSGRSAFFVFLNLPAGRAATVEYLKGLNGARQLPVETQVALVRRTILLDSAGNIMVSPIAESVQLRVYLEIPATSAAHAVSGRQAVIEWTLDRAALLRGKGGLRAVPKGEKAFAFLPGIRSSEPFEPQNREAHRPEAEMRDVMSDCTGCHAGAGVDSLLTFAQRAGRGADFEPTTVRTESILISRFKQREFNWGLLRGWLETRATTMRSPQE